MPVFEIREATPSDQPALDGLIHEGNVFHQQLLPEYLVAITADNPGREAPIISELPDESALMLAVSDTGLSVGFILINLMDSEPADWIPRKIAKVQMVVVMPEFRGQKLGAKLMGAAEKWAKEKGCDAVRLGVMARNERAHKLYKELGYDDFAIEMDKSLAT
jgi:ribosomal protein S18 acetylase RimI-like enzyme